MARPVQNSSTPMSRFLWHGRMGTYALLNSIANHQKLHNTTPNPPSLPSSRACACHPKCPPGSRQVVVLIAGAFLVPEEVSCHDGALVIPIIIHTICHLMCHHNNQSSGKQCKRILNRACLFPQKDDVGSIRRPHIMCPGMDQCPLTLRPTRYRLGQHTHHNPGVRAPMDECDTQGNSRM